MALTARDLKDHKKEMILVSGLHCKKAPPGNAVLSAFLVCTACTHFVAVPATLGTLYRSPNRTAALSSSGQQQAKEPAWRDFIRTVQKQPVSAGLSSGSNTRLRTQLTRNSSLACQLSFAQVHKLRRC